MVPQSRDALRDICARTNAEIKGEVPTRLVQLAMRNFSSTRPVEPLREILAYVQEV